MNILEKTIGEARNSNAPFRVGAIIVNKKGIPISYGHNSYKKTHPVQAKFSEKASNGRQIYLHAEIASIVGCSFVDQDRGRPYAIYVARIGKNDVPLLARPCPICMAAIEEMDIKRVFYTISEDEIGMIKL